MAYNIVFTENAVADFDSLAARQRATVRDAIKVHLTYEPTKESKSRIKRLRDIANPEFRLRVGEIRVFYNVRKNDVIIIGVMPKERSIEWLEEYGEK